MPADLARVLGLINQFVLDQLQVDVAASGDRAELKIQAPRCQLRHEKGDGLAFEDVQVQLTGLPTQKPKGGNPIEALCGFEGTLNTLTLRLLPDLWPRLAAFAGNSLAARGGRLLDRVVVDQARVGLGLKVGEGIPIRISNVSKSVRLGELENVRVEDTSIRIDGFVPGKDMKAAVEASTIVVESLKVRVFGSFINRAIDTVRDQIPSLVENFGLSLSPGRMTVNGTVRKVIAFNFAVDLLFGVKGQELTVEIERISGPGGISAPGWLVAYVLGFVNKKLAREKAVRIVDRVIFINPRKRIPPKFKVAFDFSKFTVEGNDILLELTAPADLKQAPPPPALEAEAPPELEAATPAPKPLPPGPPAR